MTSQQLTIRESVGRVNARALLARLAATPAGWSPFALRVGLGVMLLPHGLQKAFGWFGGYGFSATAEALAGMGIGLPLAWVVILTELLAPIALLLGAGTRVAAFGVGVLMAVAATFHFGNGFFMNWSGAQAGEGFEFHLLAVSMAVALVLRGGGSASVDRRLAA